MRLVVLLGQREMRTWRQEVKARVSRYATGVYIYNGCPCAAKGTMPWINKEVGKGLLKGEYQKGMRHCIT